MGRRIVAAIEAELALANALGGGRVRRKSNKTRDLKARAAGVARGSPEVMVKITSFGSTVKQVSTSGLRSHLTYISRHGEVDLENERQEILRGRADVKDLLTG